MNSAAIHESGHACALHVLQLVDVLQPGGAAVCGTGGIVALASTSLPTTTDLAAMAARVANAVPVNTEPVIEAARFRPDLAPALLVFLLSGYGAEAGTWAGDFGHTITVRTSDDFNTARQIILDLVDSADWRAQHFASETVRDALDRAAVWAAQSHVRTFIDRVAAHLEAHGAATWAELETIFSAHVEASRGDTLAPSVCAPGSSPVAGTMPGATTGNAHSVEAENATRGNTITPSAGTSDMPPMHSKGVDAGPGKPRPSTMKEPAPATNTTKGKV